MLMGPVFRAELLRTARQRRYYVLRLIFGSILLLVVWIGYDEMRRGQPVVHMADVAQFATGTFISFATVQLVALLLLVPAVFGGVVADEKQRKTLHYLMASQLSSGEIILDKVLGRSAHLAIFVAIGMPVVSLLGLFGGISVESVALAYVGTFSTLAFAVGLTVLASTLARRVRDAILIAYLLVLMWLFVPPSILFFGRVLLPRAHAWIGPVNDWLADTSPVGLWLRSESRLRIGGATPFVDQFLWAVENQLACAAILLLVAIGRLRPTFRRQEETPARRTWFRARRDRPRPRWTAHPECGDDPILWKERHFAPVDRFTRLVLLPAIVFVTLPLALITAVEGGILWGARYQGAFRWALQLDLGWYVALWLLAIAGGAASCVTIEREKDTWVSLTATPLTGREILRGKLLGAIWNQRGFAAVLILIWALGLISGAVHPLGVLASIAVVALMTWLAATVGAYASLRASSTSRAIAAALTTLAIINGYPLLLLWSFLGRLGWESSYPVLGLMPSLAAWSMVPGDTFNPLWMILDRSMDPRLSLMLGPSLLIFYAAVALALTRRIVGGFDRWLDRPPLSLDPPRAPVPARHLEEVAA